MGSISTDWRMEGLWDLFAEAGIGGFIGGWFLFLYSGIWLSMSGY